MCNATLRQSCPLSSRMEIALVFVLAAGAKQWGHRFIWHVQWCDPWIVGSDCCTLTGLQCEPEGATVAMPSYPVLHDDAVYGPDVEVFDPFRFSKRRQQAAAGKEDGNGDHVRGARDAFSGDGDRLPRLWARAARLPGPVLRGRGAQGDARARVGALRDRAAGRAAARQVDRHDAGPGHEGDGAGPAEEGGCCWCCLRDGFLEGTLTGLELILRLKPHVESVGG